MSLSDVGTPLLPVLCSFAVFFQTLLFLAEVLGIVDENHGGAVYLVEICNERTRNRGAGRWVLIVSKTGKE